MGLAASQARLLLLTARKSDLEYRAQMISQRKIALSMETEKIATAYTEALNNRHMMFAVWASPNAQTKEQVELTFDNLTSGLNGTTVYRVVEPNSGKIACTNIEKDVHRFINAQQYNATYDPKEGLVWNDGATDENKAAYQAAVAEMKANMIEAPGLNNPGYFQDLLQTGALALERQNVTTVENPVIDPETGEQRVDENNNPVTEKKFITEWEPLVLSGMDDISSELYTEDDNAAMAAYEHKSLLVQSQDKQLDVELKQIETQLEACKAEKESVQKLVGERAKEDFKLFG